MKVLLVEPPYKRTYLPLGLMKICSYHKAKGDEVEYTRRLPYFQSSDYDRVYITSLYSWDVDLIIQYVLSYSKSCGKDKVLVGGVCATLKKEMIKGETGIEVSEGIRQEFEKQTPDYSLFPRVDYRIGFTSRGCTRKCGWCMVKYHEPKYIEYDDWEEKLNVRPFTNRIILWDNNFLAATDKHFESSIQKLRMLQRYVDFNQGLDARLLTPERAKLFARLKMECIRFAFDSMGSDGQVQKALDLVKEHKIKGEPRVYVLYNHMDKPEDFYYRLKEIKLHGGKSYPMKYQDLEAKKKSIYVGKHWTREMLHVFENRLNSFFQNGMVGSQKMEIFEKAFGRNEKEFSDILQEGKPEMPANQSSLTSF